MPTACEIGAEAETDACRFLESAGLQLIQRNYRCKMGEIDLIMQDKETLVFVEVRKRSHPDFGSGVESISPEKQRRIIKTALHYLLETQQYDAVPTRIDVVDIGLHTGHHAVEWIKNAIMEKW